MLNTSCNEYASKRESSCNKSIVLRKGAWTAEEDMLLKNCIEKFGEGKWHLVPLRAGLSRCRKSCRLRWLNYLRPNIKRGGFAEDEVDLILRLHKLLGNKWSLIAGRIPGRTANDVKNYWNTHVRSRPRQQQKEQHTPASQHKTVTIIKPKPCFLSKTINLHPHFKPHENGFNTSTGLDASPTLSDDDKINEYLNELFDDRDKDGGDKHGVGWSLFSGEEGLSVIDQEDGQNSYFDFATRDVDIWDLLAPGQL